MLKQIIESKPEKHISSGKFSISSIGCCWYKKFMEIKKLYKEKFDEKTFRVFAQGDFFHQLLVSEFISKGPSHGYQVAAAECNIRDQPYISGRCDMILSHAPSKELYIVDFKSCSKWVFDNVKKGIVSEIYKNQVLLYMYIFHIKRGYLLFVDKSSSEVEEYEVEYDSDKAEFLINQIKYFFENFVKMDVSPPRCNGGIFGCKCCWSNSPNNKPTIEQLEAVKKQQDNIPKLFQEFHPRIEMVPVILQSASNSTLDKRWSKVI